MKRIIILCFLICLFLCSCSTNNKHAKYIRYVDPDDGESYSVRIDDDDVLYYEPDY